MRRERRRGAGRESGWPRSLLSWVSFSHRSNSAGPNRSLGSISLTTRYTPVHTGAGSVAA